MIAIEKVRQTAKFDAHIDKIFKTIRGQFQAETNADLVKTADKIMQSLLDSVPYYTRSGMIKKISADLISIHISVYSHKLLPIILHSALYNDNMMIVIKVETLGD